MTADGGQRLSAPIRFVAKVGTQPFSCGTTYAGLGLSNTSYQPKDLRFYVHDIRLVSHEGDAVKFDLANDGAFQKDGIALLDFEDATGLCSNGTAATHTQLTGSLPQNHYHLLKFTLGVPFAQNHQDATTALAPLNNSGMWWNWNGGYKFMRIDGNTTGLPGGHNLHLGSTGCVDDGNGGVSSCDRPNRPEVSLTGFDPLATTIVIDYAAVVAASDLATNGGGPPGCMSGTADPECGPVFDRLGIDVADGSIHPEKQVLFRAK